jgi:multiple sugar transport system substrate-binding protein
MLSLASCSSQKGVEETATPITLRLGVSLTPQEAQSFQPAIDALEQAHPEWQIVLENTPQSGIIEKINTQLASNELPDIIRVQGLQAQQWIRQNAFYAVDDLIQESNLDLDEFYSGPLDHFLWENQLWGIPDTAAPDVVFYNKTMFYNAGLAYPTYNWSY